MGRCPFFFYTDDHFQKWENLSKGRGHMTRSLEEMTQIILDGGSILYGSRVLTRIEELPTRVELAGDDIVERQFALRSLEEAAQKALRDVAMGKQAIGAELSPDELKIVGSNVVEYQPSTDMGLGPAAGIVARPVVAPRQRELVA